MPGRSIIALAFAALSCGQTESSDDSVESVFESLSLERSWGPCRPEAVCFSTLRLDGDGIFTRDGEGRKGSVPVEPTELDELRRLAVSSATRNALSDPVPCNSAQGMDTMEFLLVRTMADELKKNVLNCHQDPYEPLRAGLFELRDKYLPDP